MLRPWNPPARFCAGFEAYSWIGVFAPSATPAATVHRLTEDFQATLNTPEIRTKLVQSGFEVMATDGPALDRWVRQEYERWGRFVRDNKVQLED
jgi:tripartite-type tricarboxylate transporter receptor subunit TctC